MSWQTTRFKMYATIGGGEVDVVDATFSYEMNNIPRCTIQLPVGRRIPDLSASPIHSMVEELTQMQPLKLFLEGEVIGKQGPGGDNFPGGSNLVFEGYVTGTGYRRTSGGTAFVIHAKNWLVDLDYSSSLSASSHPMNPSQYSYQASTFAQGANSGTDAKWAPFSVDDISSGTFLTDFWEGGLKKVLESIAETDHVNTLELPSAPNGGSNTTALEALKRVNNGATAALRLDGADSELIGNAMANGLRSSTYQSYANHTMWNKIVGELLPLHMLAIVPRVEDALVVPFIPGLRKTYIKIKSSDYDYVDLGAELHRTLKSVGVFAGVAYDTGYDTRKGPGKFGIGGWYENDSVDRGMILLKHAPPWLSAHSLGHMYTQKSSGEGTRAISTAITPGEGDAPDRDPPEVLVGTQKNLIDNYAKSLYAAEALKGRQGNLSGKLRLDIAPGSTVEIETAGEEFIANDGLGQPRFATVLRVTTQINGEAQKAGTAFGLAHIRNKKENEAEGTSMDQPPIWENAWPGDSLSPAFAGQSQ